MRVLLSLVGLAAVAAPVGAQPAQPAPAVVLLVPEEVRAEWTAALQLELAARGAVAIPAEAPEAPTPLLGDAEAQRVAIQHGAGAAAWAQPAPDGWRLRMVSPSAERARVVPVARDADARTVALILVSLLDTPEEPAGPSAPAAQPAPPEPIAPPARALAAPSSDETSNEADDRRPARAEPYVHWTGVVGASALLLTNDRRADFGVTLRAGIAMRYDWFEAAVLHDIGPYLEWSQNNGAQPYGRVCVELGGGTPRVSASFHAGGRGCFGSIFALETGGGVGMGELFVSHTPRTHVSGGIFLAVSFRLVDQVRLWVRTDLDIAWTDFVLRDSIDAVPALATMLTFG